MFGSAPTANAARFPPDVLVEPSSRRHLVGYSNRFDFSFPQESSLDADGSTVCPLLASVVNVQPHTDLLLARELSVIDLPWDS